jgi:hypothetical protein
MTDLLQGAALWLQGQLKANASQPLSYTRGANRVAVQGSPTDSLLALSEDFDGRVERTDADFVIATADLVAAFAALAVTFATPQRGDTVTWGTQVYQVLAPGNEPPWRWQDPYHVMIRVHGKRLT